MSALKHGSSLGLMKPLTQIKKKYESTFQQTQNDNFGNQLNKLGDILEKFNTIMDVKMNQIKNSLSNIAPTTQAKKDAPSYLDAEPRFTEMRFPFKSILHEKDKAYRMKQIKTYAADLARAIITKGFTWFQQNKIPDEKLRQFFCNNFIANIVRYADQNKIQYQQLRQMDKHLKDNVFSFLKRRYPQNQSGQANRKFDALVVPQDNMISNKNDLVFPSGVKFKYKQNGDYSQQIMEFINYMLKVTREQQIQVEDKSTGQNKKVNLTQLYFKEMEDIFQKVQSQQWMINARTGSFSQQKKNQQKLSSKDINDIDISKQGKKEKYKKTVKQYTKYLIGQKISENFTKFSEKQIQEQNLTVSNSGVMRILTKWCQQLQNCFEETNINSRDQKFRMVNGSQRYISRKARRELFEQLSKQDKQRQKFVSKIKQNIYQNQYKMLTDPQKKCLNAFRQFASQDEGIAGYFATVMKKSYDNYIISYLNQLIHKILSAQQKLKSKFTKKQYYKIAVNLITFKIGDLLRCKCSSKQPEIIALYSYLKYYCSRKNSNLQIVRVKNRLSQGTKDILINFRYCNKLLVQMQLAINQQTSHFIKCSDKTNHFIYELQRATFGPISQICNVYAGVDPRYQFFRKKFESIKFNKDNPSNIKCVHLQKHKDNSSQQQNDVITNTNLPVWCDICKSFTANLNLVIKHKRCSKCPLTICSACLVKNGKYQKVAIDKQVKQYKQVKLVYDELKSGNFLRKKIKIFDLQMKKETQTIIYIVYFNFKLFLFESLDDSKDSDAVDNIQKGVTYLGQAKNQKQLNNLLQNKLILKQYDIIQNDDDKAQQILKKFMYIEIIKVTFKNIKKKYKKYFVFEEIQLQDRALIGNCLPTVQQLNINNAQINSLNNLLITFPNARCVLIHKNKIKSLERVSKWPKIQQLNLQGNKLSQVPEQIQQLQNLKFILLTNNKFTKFPQNICRLKSLQILNFKQNKFDTISDKIGQLKTLKILRLNQNRIKQIPKEIKNLQRLEQIDMSQNCIKTFPEQLKKLTKIEKFIFQCNQIHSVPKDMFDNMKCLTLVDLSDNKQLNEIPSSLKDKQKLRKIYLCCNKITVIPQFVLNLPQLQELLISENQINKIEIPRQKKIPQKLKILQINQNKLKELPDQIFSINSIQRLKLGSNQFKGKQFVQKIAPKFTRLTNLKFLDLQNLDLRAIPDSVIKISKLETLGLDNNKITQIANQVTHSSLCKTLIDLYLKNNSLKKIPQQIFALQQLQNLGISKNQIQKIPPNISELKKLQKLTIEDTEIKTLPESLLKIATLKQLFLTKSKFDPKQLQKKGKNPKFKIIDSVQEKKKQEKKKLQKEKEWEQLMKKK